MPTTQTGQSYSFVIGPINLADFCNCPNPPCPECCGQTCGACTGIPNTLTLSISCSDTVTLTWDSVNSWWAGTDDAHCGSFCFFTEPVVKWRFACSNPATNQFSLKNSCDDF